MSTRNRKRSEHAEVSTTTPPSWNRSAFAPRDGEEALTVVSSRLGGFATVETHQFVRGNDPYEDVLEQAEDIDADEIVIGIRKRNPTAKVVFGSTTQRILLHSNRPIAVVPLVEVDE
jgi:nucleotide-binding universal stress UspA family protein